MTVDRSPSRPAVALLLSLVLLLVPLGGLDVAAATAAVAVDPASEVEVDDATTEGPALPAEDHDSVDVGNDGDDGDDGLTGGDTLTGVAPAPGEDPAGQPSDEVHPSDDAGEAGPSGPTAPDGPTLEGSTTLPPAVRADGARDASRWLSVPGSRTVPEGSTWTASARYGNSVGWGPGTASLQRLVGVRWEQVGASQLIVPWQDQTFRWSIAGFSASDAGTYRLLAHHGDSFASMTAASSTFSLRAQLARPEVTRAPQDVEASVGETAVLTVETSDPRAHVQWQRAEGGQWVDIPGAVERQLRIADVTLGDDGFYQATLWNPAQGELEVTSQVTTSASARLTVRRGPTITQQPPANRTAAPGETATLTAAASGSAPMTVQWRQSRDGGTTWVDSPGASAQTTSFTTPALTLADHGTLYHAVFSNSEGMAVTREVRLSVLDGQITFVQQPASTVSTLGPEVVSNWAATFSTTVALNGDTIPTFIWERSEDGGDTWDVVSEIPPQNVIISSYVELTITEAKDGWMYRVTAVGERSTAVSDPATLTVRRQMSITQQPGDAPGVEREAAIFTATASGYPAPTVQWQRSVDGGDWADVPGATAGSLTVSSLTLDEDGDRYRAVFTNPTGQLVSEAATLSVSPARPLITLHPADQVAVEGGRAVFDASYLDNGVETTVQWQFSQDGSEPFAYVPGHVGPDGARSLPLTIDPVTAEMDGWSYRVRLTNETGSTWSEPAVLRLAATIPDAAGRTTAGSEVEVTVWSPDQAGYGTFEASAPAGTRFVRGRTNGTTTQVVVSEDGRTAWSDRESSWGGSTLTAWLTLRVDDDAEPGTVLEGGTARVVHDDVVVAQGGITVTVLGVPQVTEHPASTAVVAPGGAQLTAAASGYPAPTVRWQLSTDGGDSWSDLDGATHHTLDIEGTTREMNGYQYRAVFSNEADDHVPTEPATLRVLHDVTATLLVTPRVQMVVDLPW